MTKYVIKRILLALCTCFIVLSIAYLLLCCLRIEPRMDPEPGARYAYYMDYVSNGFLVYSLNEARPDLGTPLDVVTLTATNETYYFYQAPVFHRYVTLLTGVFTRWNWGDSIYIENGIPAMQVLTSRLGTTVSINIISVFFSVPLGIGLGVICALKKDSIFDNIVQVLIMVIIAIPSFVLVSYCVLLAYNTSWLPPYFQGGSTDPARRIASYLVPVFVLAIGSLCGYARFVRAELCEVLQSDYLLLARTKGLTRRQAIMRHAFRNAMVPVLPSVVSEFIAILGGSMILENLYQINGVGRLYMEAFNAKDYSVLMADMAFYTAIGLLASIIVDLSYGFIDPRIRMGAKK